MINGRDRYEWCVPTGNYGQAHAFVLGARPSLCVRMERGALGEPGWETETLGRGEPRRARCSRCVKLLEAFPNMREAEL